MDPEPGHSLGHTLPVKKEASTTAEAVRERLRAWGKQALATSNRVRLPGPAVLPVAGALVGLYSGLAAGLFSNLIAFVSIICFAIPRLPGGWREAPKLVRMVEQAFAKVSWHPEYIMVAVPIALAALMLSKVISPGEPRDEVKRRLRVLSLLLLGALSLYYPLKALGTLNAALGASEGLLANLDSLPFAIRLALPALGGLWVGRILRDLPETHGHGVPEVVMAVRRQREALRTRGGLLKLVASAITIGSGGSAGREGPIVFGGAAFASGVARTLGFTRKELGVLMAAGAGAGIAATFDVPLAGAVFAFEIILRDFELSVLSPIILASVSATLVNRGVVGEAFRLVRIDFSLVSGWEIGLYALLGLTCGVVAYAFVRLLHGTEAFFQGHMPGVFSRTLARLTLSQRAAIGGVLVGLLSMVNPAVWGTGHEVLNLANAGRLGLGFLVQACVLKLVATSLTIGSGGSGGTFFPSLVLGGMAGGAFGTVAHSLWPSVTAGSGAYALTGMGAAVAGFTRGPLTGLMIVYELTGTRSILLPLMVSTTIASALCHWLVERKTPKVVSEADVMRNTQVRQVAHPVSPVGAKTHLRPLVDAVLASAEGALPVLDAEGHLYGVVQLSQLAEVWKDESLVEMLNAVDVAQPVPPLSGEVDLQSALEQMDRLDMDALPVVDRERSFPYALITRAAVRRFVAGARAEAHAHAHEPVAPTELSR